MDEEQAIIEFLQRGDLRPGFEDDLHRRVIDVFEDSGASSLDRTVIIRQLLRRWSLRDHRDVPVGLTEEFAFLLRSAAAESGLWERPDGMWIARPWSPGWMEQDGVAPDMAASAGTEIGVRFRPEPLRADPFFEDITGYSNYRTPGQRAACRAVMSTPEGSTVVAMLPTGSGKTEIALCLAERSKYGLTVIIVPTVALAYDFERRFRDHFARRNKRVKPGSLSFAWTAATDDVTRQRLTNAISQGQQPLLVTSPESMTRALRQTLLDAASIGRLQGIVIDEAHLVTQWGRFFRPEFRTLADLRRDLLDRAEQGGYSRPVTLLLSATLGAAEMQDLVELFGFPGPCNPIVANSLRSEPDIWIAPASDMEQRASRVMETLAHCARPAVLYVTKPEKAERWLSELRLAGYSRVASVTGLTKASERAAVLEGLRMGAGAPRALDLVVATSAFGLGIDYPHIRSIVHACLPETVDRWYQELGRGGRDGDASAAFLLTAPGDEQEAADLGVKVLSPAIASDRWTDMWEHREKVNGRTFVDLEGARGRVGRGDYNRRWNAQVIQGLIELGELRREQFEVEDLRELLGSDDVDVADWTAISFAGARMGDPGFWENIWVPWQRSEMDRSGTSLAVIQAVSRLRLAACEGVSTAYSPSQDLLADWGNRLRFMEPIAACGRCPDCRQRGVSVYLGHAPSPDQVWATGSVEDPDLGRFVTTAHGTHGVAFLTYVEGEEHLATPIAHTLIKLGVRHIAGLARTEELPSIPSLFCDDDPLTPFDLTPMSSFSFFGKGRPISRRWLARRETPRSGVGGVLLSDVLLIPSGTSVGGRLVGRDIPALPADTALELLPRS